MRTSSHWCVGSISANLICGWATVVYLDKRSATTCCLPGMWLTCRPMLFLAASNSILQAMAAKVGSLVLPVLRS